MTIKTLKFKHQPFLREFIEDIQDCLEADVNNSENGIVLQVCIFSEEDERKIESLKITHFIKEEV